MCEWWMLMTLPQWLSQLHVVLVSAYRILSAAGPCTFVNSDIFIARNPSSGGLFGNPPERLTWWGIICQRRHIGDWKIRCDDDSDVWAGTRRPDGNGWSLPAIWASHWCPCVCMCSIAILLQCHCIAKMINVTNSAASLHHSAATALVICFHCDAREQLQK